MTAAAPAKRSIEAISPFRRSPATAAPLAAAVRGEIPDFLRGQLVRTCPAVFESSGWRASHWFDALGMVYAFEINGPSSVEFRSRLLESEAARDASSARSRLGSFGTPLVRTLWQRIFEPIPRQTDNTNVNIVRMGGELVAMTESDRQLVLDDETFTPRGSVTYEDRLGSVLMSAHPHFDFERDRVVNVATKLSSQAELIVYEHAPSARKREPIGSVRGARFPYVHSFGLTPENAILIAHPLSAKPLDLLWSNRGFIDHFAWQPGEGTRLIVMDRASGATREHSTEAFFVFHTVNAFERDGETVLDVLAYSNPDVIAALRVDALVEQLPELRPSLLRVSMRAGTEAARVEKLCDVGFEFPALSYRRVSGRDYHFAYGASDGPDAQGGYSSSLVKVDVRSGATKAFADGEHVFGEPIFVARPEAAAEDEGVLVSVGSSKNADRSLLAVVDARSMTLVASAEVASAVPLGFHGSFARANAA